MQTKDAGFALVVTLLSAAVGGCGSAGSARDPDDAAVTPDAGERDLSGTVDDAGGFDGAVVDGTIVSGPPTITLPIAFTRADVGTPLTPAELATATDELIALFHDTRYFDFVDERVHGWPKSDASHPLWYGTWWSGVSITKSAGLVTYAHGADGADNNGLRTAPYLEGACYAHLMWGGATTGDLVRRMTRGYAAWALGMVRQVGDANPTLLARAIYPTSVASSDGGRALFIDYGLDRPGVDASPSSYVHLPGNPSFGDLYVKNKRSKDDVPHMLRSLAQTQACDNRLGADGLADLTQARSLYQSWAQRVDAQGFVIETLDPSGNLWAPPDQLARYTLAGNLECLGALAVRLMGGVGPGSLDCGDGLPALEAGAWTLLKNDARQIQRTNHAAALTLAYRVNQLALASSLIGGLARRLDLDMGLAESASPPSGFELRDVASELICAANVGVPLTSREVRWLHARLHEAYLGMREPQHAATFRVFDPATPDGSYAFDPPDVGLFHRDLGMMIGACASPNRNPAGRALLDCAKLLAAF